MLIHIFKEETTLHVNQYPCLYAKCSYWL